MKKMMLLFGFVFMVGVASSETNEYQTALSIGFEEEEGHVLGEIVWQNGWTGRQGRHEVTADTACSGTQSLNFNGIETGDYDAEYRFECDNPDGLPMHISFKFKPSENGLLRFYPFEGQGHIINMFLGRTQFSADAPKYMFKNIEPALDSNEWYEAGLYLNPIDRVVDSFYLGDCFFEDEYGYEYMEYGETGVPDGIAFYTSWADDKTVAYVDDVKVEVMLPEPACLGLLALAGLFFLRKRS